MVAGGVTAAAAIGLFAWDTQKTRGSDGYLHGPYESWQIATMVGVLLVVAIWGGVRGETVPGAASAAIGAYLGVIANCVSTDGSDGAFFGFFIGAVLAGAVFAGVVSVGYVAALLPSQRSGPAVTSPPH